MQRAEGRGVGNGLDRDRVDIVVNDRATRMQTDNRDHKTTITHSIGCCSGTQTGNHNHKMGHGLGASASNTTTQTGNCNCEIHVGRPSLSATENWLQPEHMPTIIMAVQQMQRGEGGCGVGNGLIEDV